MTHDGDDDGDDPGLPGLHQDDAAGDLGRDHDSPSGARSTATAAASTTTCARRPVPRLHEPGDARRGRPGPRDRRRGDRGGPAAPARPDVAHGDGRGDDGRGLHAPHVRDRGEPGGRQQAHADPRARGRAEARRADERRAWRPTAPAAAGRGCSATSRRCSRPARGSRADSRHRGGGPAPAGSPPGSQISATTSRQAGSTASSWLATSSCASGRGRSRGSAAVSHASRGRRTRNPNSRCRPARIRSARSPRSWATRKSVVIAPGYPMRRVGEPVSGHRPWVDARTRETDARGDHDVAWCRGRERPSAAPADHAAVVRGAGGDRRRASCTGSSRPSRRRRRSGSPTPSSS